MTDPTGAEIARLSHPTVGDLSRGAHVGGTDAQSRRDGRRDGREVAS
jgi:hypothetical protein